MSVGLDHNSAQDRLIDVGLRTQGHVLKGLAAWGLTKVGGFMIKAMSVYGITG